MNCPNCGAPPLRPPAAICNVCGADRSGSGPDAPAWEGKHTRLSPPQVMATMAQSILAQGAIVTSQSETTMTGTLTVARQPNILAAVLLFLLCIVPMIIYIIVQSRPDVFGWSVHVYPDETGSTVTYSAQGAAAAIIFRSVSALPERDEAPDPKP